MTDHGKTADDLSIREQILYEGARLTSGDRNDVYGDPTRNHYNVASLWNAYLGIRSDHRHVRLMLDAEDAEIMMVLVKIARAAQRIGEDMSADTFVDMATYAAMAGEARDERVKRRKANND